MSRYKQIYDGQGFKMPANKLWRFACCDCGLVHDVVLVSHDGKSVGLAMRRNKKATKKRRKGMK